MTTLSTLSQARLDQMRDAARAFDDRAFSRADAAETAFLAKQLEIIRPGLLEVKYPDLMGERWVPMNFGMDPGAETYTVRFADRAGSVQVVRDMNNFSMPTEEVSVREATVSFFDLAGGYRYSLQEARAAILARMPLNAKKALDARWDMARKMDYIALLGGPDDAVGTTALKGLFTLANTTVYTTPAGTGGDTEFSTKSSDEVIKDLAGAESKIVNDTKDTYRPDTMILPLSIRQDIAARRVGDGTDRSILRYYLDNALYVRTVDQSALLEANAGWTGKRGVVYKKDPNVLEMIVSVVFEQLPAQTNGFSTTVLTHGRTAGVCGYAPQAVAYFDEI